MRFLPLEQGKTLPTSCFFRSMRHLVVSSCFLYVIQSLPPIVEPGIVGYFSKFIIWPFFFHPQTTNCPWQVGHTRAEGSSNFHTWFFSPSPSITIIIIERSPIHRTYYACIKRKEICKLFGKVPTLY